MSYFDFYGEHLLAINVSIWLSKCAAYFTFLRSLVDNNNFEYFFRISINICK